MSDRQTRTSPVLSLAMADLWHERVLTACIVLALAAVVAPLLILLSLKEGVVDSMRERMIEDPTFREITPTTTQNYSPQLLDSLRAREEVTFLVPTIYFGMSGVIIETASGERLNFDLSPTGPGDPLLLENGGRDPEPGEIVLTATAAADLGVGPGDQVPVIITRRSRSEEVRHMAVVAAVLDIRAGASLKVYAPVELVLDVEAYKRGEAVPQRGWTGGEPLAPPQFDGVIAAAPSDFEPVMLIRLTTGTGVNRYRPIDADEVTHLTGVQVSDAWSYYELTAQGARIDNDVVRRTRARLGGRNAVTVPFVRPIAVETVAGERVFLRAGSMRPFDAERLGAAAPYWGDPSDPLAEMALRSTPSLVTPITINYAPTGAFQLIPAEIRAAIDPSTGEEGLTADETSEGVLAADGASVAEETVPAGEAASGPDAPMAPDGTAAGDAEQVAEDEGRSGEAASGSEAPQAPEGTGTDDPEQATDDASGASDPEAPQGEPPIADDLEPPGAVAASEQAAAATEDTDATLPQAEPDTVPGADAETRTDIVGDAAAASPPASENEPVLELLVPTQLLGVLNAGRDGGVEYVDGRGFLQARDGYRGFRLYTRSIDDVPALVSALRDQDIAVASQVSQISSVQELNRGLNILFFLVAGVAVTGALAALGASLYASVMRKTRELGILGLLGLSRSALFRFPIWQSIVVALAGSLLAIAITYGFSALINSSLAHSLRLADQISKLPASFASIALVLTIVAALICSLFAAFAATRIDPAEAIRDE